MSFKMQVDIGNRLFGQSPNEIVGCGLSSRKGDRNTYFDDLETVAEKIKKRDGLNPILHADQNTVYASKGFDEERPSCALGYAMPKAYREAATKKGGPSQRSRAKSNTRGNKGQSRRRKKESTKSVYKTLTTAVNEINALDVKMAKTTDYSRSIGAFASKDKAYKFNGSYWTRTPSNDFAYCAWNVNAGGVLSEYAVDGSSHSIRPCIQISF